ncbi:MAG TPA: hypothetical protein VFW35_01140 [Sphingomicrobium sp.]|nr:hypothetical protein [Sphingomicrobium sp.]
MKRPPPTDEMDLVRVERAAKERKERSFAEDKALDAAVRNSIKLHGA